jgi:cephalosporin hydroxylase
MNAETRRGIIRYRKGIVLVILILCFGCSSSKDNLSEQEIIERFTRIYYRSRVWGGQTKWFGVDSLQTPCDNWAMQEIIWEVKPDYIVETGTYTGGTALFYATVLEKVSGMAKVLTMDMDPKVEEASKHKLFNDRVQVIKGNSLDPEIVRLIREKVKNKKVILTLDSNHKKEHVLKELNLYADIVSPGSYMVVQDTSIDIYGLAAEEVGAGPMEAVKEFLKTRSDFEIDHSREKFLLTFYPSGFLKRVK